MVVVDGRASFATPERFPADRVDRLVVGWPDEVADEIGLGPDDAVAVLTHDVKFDEPAIVEALRRGCRYVGAVGSKKTQGDRRERLREAGVTRRGARAAPRARRAGPRRAATRPRRRSRSWPRSSRSGTAAAARPLVDRARAVEAAAVGWAAGRERRGGRAGGRRRLALRRRQAPRHPGRPPDRAPRHRRGRRRRPRSDRHRRPAGATRSTASTSRPRSR